MQYLLCLWEVPHAYASSGHTVIRVRYKNLSPGLHGLAESSADGTVVYLLPGLTGGQRSAALRRLRQEASRGCGPDLRGPDLRVALAADRFRTGVLNTAAVVRLHPVGSLVPAALAALLMALFVLASVSPGVVQLPQPGLPGELFSIGGDPTAVGSPVLAQPSTHGVPASGSHGAAGGVRSGNPGSSRGSASSSLVESSTKVSAPHTRSRHRGKNTRQRDARRGPGARAVPDWFLAPGLPE
jgi:hypothetical protein